MSKNNIKREFNNVNRGWYSIQPAERLVLVYDFRYEPCETQEEYNRQLLDFINMVDITTDKIITVENVSEGYDKVHAYGDGGIEQNAIVRFVGPPPPANTVNAINQDHCFVYVGNIPNMPGYCVVIDVETGLAYTGYKTSQFSVVNEII